MIFNLPMTIWDRVKTLWNQMETAVQNIFLNHLTASTPNGQRLTMSQNAEDNNTIRGRTSHELPPLERIFPDLGTYTEGRSREMSSQNKEELERQAIGFLSAFSEAEKVARANGWVPDSSQTYVFDAMQNYSATLNQPLPGENLGSEFFKFPEGWLTIHIHGSPTGFSRKDRTRLFEPEFDVPVSAEELADLIKQQLGEKGTGQNSPIFLVSCAAGGTLAFGPNAAQKLSSLLGRPVVAPTGILHHGNSLVILKDTYPTQPIVELTPGGTWRAFSPDEAVILQTAADQRIEKIDDWLDGIGETPAAATFSDNNWVIPIHFRLHTPNQLAEALLSAWLNRQEELFKSLVESKQLDREKIETFLKNIEKTEKDVIIDHLKSFFGKFQHVRIVPVVVPANEMHTFSETIGLSGEFVNSLTKNDFALASRHMFGFDIHPSQIMDEMEIEYIPSTGEHKDVFKAKIYVRDMNSTIREVPFAILKEEKDGETPEQHLHISDREFEDLWSLRNSNLVPRVGLLGEIDNGRRVIIEPFIPGKTVTELTQNGQFTNDLRRSLTHTLFLISDRLDDQFPFDAHGGNFIYDTSKQRMIMVDIGDLRADIKPSLDSGEIEIYILLALMKNILKDFGDISNINHDQNAALFEGILSANRQKGMLILSTIAKSDLRAMELMDDDIGKTVMITREFLSNRELNPLSGDSSLELVIGWWNNLVVATAFWLGERMTWNEARQQAKEKLASPGFKWKWAPLTELPFLPGAAVWGGVSSTLGIGGISAAFSFLHNLSPPADAAERFAKAKGFWGKAGAVVAISIETIGRTLKQFGRRDAWNIYVTNGEGKTRIAFGVGWQFLIRTFVAFWINTWALQFGVFVGDSTVAAFVAAYVMHSIFNASQYIPNFVLASLDRIKLVVTVLATATVSTTFAVVAAPIVMANFMDPLGAFFLISLVSQLIDPSTAHALSQDPVSGLVALIFGTASNFSTYVFSLGAPAMLAVGVMGGLFTAAVGGKIPGIKSLKNMLAGFALSVGIALTPATAAPQTANGPIVSSEAMTNDMARRAVLKSLVDQIPTGSVLEGIALRQNRVGENWGPADFAGVGKDETNRAIEILRDPATVGKSIHRLGEEIAALAANTRITVGMVGYGTEAMSTEDQETALAILQGLLKANQQILLLSDDPLIFEKLGLTDGEKLLVRVISAHHGISMNEILNLYGRNGIPLSPIVLASEGAVDVSGTENQYQLRTFQSIAVSVGKAIAQWIAVLQAA